MPTAKKKKSSTAASPGKPGPSRFQAKAEELLLKRESAWTRKDASSHAEVFAFAEEYKAFLAAAKTERLAVDRLAALCRKHGFTEFSGKGKLAPGAKFYEVTRGKSILAGIVGKDPASLRLIGSHGDSPRLDLKPHPLYEDGAELALLRSHYYGGVKKYQWLNLPLAIHGVAHTKAGRRVEIHLGENEGDPVFIIPDLLPHLAQEQMKKEAARLVEGEELNVIVGHLPVPDPAVKDRIKLAVLIHLHERWGLCEEDLACAELELVPAGKPVDVGFDRAILGGYGQDDRVCAYTSFRALTALARPAHTAVAWVSDKEETGSSGNTGADSNFLERFARAYVAKVPGGLDPVEFLSRAKSISADVTSALDATFKGPYEASNTSVFGRGVTLQKYVGAGGKGGTNDAHAEYMHFLRDLAARSRIPWQTGEFGKVDHGGGGTISKFMARYGMDCVDAGPCVLGMHSPVELTSKSDVYQAYRFYRAFLES
ncbi:MAG: aminopeptidase [Spirochaetes bacterium]|nr:aminopeptidase [Spirochaetota bacterium]